VAQVRPGCVPASVPPSPARPTMKGRGVPGGVCPAALVLRPARLAGWLSAGGRPRLGLAVSLRRVSPGARGLTGPVRPRGPYSLVIKRRREGTPSRPAHWCRSDHCANDVGVPVPCGLPARRQGGPRAAASAPDFRVPSPLVSPLTDRAQPEGHRAAAPVASVPVPCTWCPTRSECSEPYLTMVDSPLPRPSSDRAPALTSPGLQVSGPSRCEPGPGGLFRGGPVAAVMRVEEFETTDRARMREPVPPSLPDWHHLFPPGVLDHGRRAGFVPRPGLTCRPSCSDARRASESVAPRFTGPVPPGRFRSEVQSTRADRVRAVVGRGPASPDAACLVGGAVVRVTCPGRPKGRGVVHASAYPGPVGITSQRRPGRDTPA
jgi:hypothetical protein